MAGPTSGGLSFGAGLSDKAPSSALVIGTTAVTGGSAGQLLFDTGGTLGETAGVIYTSTGGSSGTMPQLQFTNQAGTGNPSISGTNNQFGLGFVSSGTMLVWSTSAGVSFGLQDTRFALGNSGWVYAWVAGASVNNSVLDTGLSRGSAGVVDVGNGNQGDASGKVNAAAYQVAGTQVVSSQITGYGTPTGAGRISNFTGSAATLAQTGQQLAQVILDLKAHGLLGA